MCTRAKPSATTPTSRRPPRPSWPASASRVMPWRSPAWPNWPAEADTPRTRPTMAAPPKFPVDEREVEFSAIRAQGAGGQNVNKVSSAIHLRFDIHASSLPDAIKERLLCLSDSRITQEGVLVLKAQQHRTQEMNRADALARLQEVVDGVS